MIRATEAITSATRYLADADRLLPGRIVGFYVVGSVALGEYQHGRSDIDVVVVVDGDLDAREVKQVRSLQVRSGLRTAGTALRRGHQATTGTCNAVYLRADDLTRPVRRIEPIVVHIGHLFLVGARGLGSDVSPVAWQVLSEHGIALRGPEPSTLGLDGEPEALREWNLDNLDRYWRPWAAGVTQHPRRLFGVRPRWATAWGALGAPRLHHTIATGRVISKEAAGAYARDVFPPVWHPLLDEALAYRHHHVNPSFRVSPAARGRLTAAFVLHVADAAGEIAAAREVDLAAP